MHDDGTFLDKDRSLGELIERIVVFSLL